MNRISLPAAVCAAALGGFVAFAAYAHYHSPAAKSTVEKFYHMWTDSSIHPLIERSYRGSPYLTREFQRRLDRLGRTFEKTRFDPVVCGGVQAASYSVGFADASSDRPLLRVAMALKDGGRASATVAVARQADGTWLIDGIECPRPPLDRAAAEGLVGTEINALSPEKAVLGGTFRVTAFSWKDDDTAVVSYEDGHIALEADVTFVMEGQKPVVSAFTVTRR